MSEEKISRQEFDRLWQEFLKLAERLREKDRHDRGGTTIGEMESDALGEGIVSVLQDPEYIRSEVKRRLDWWLGDREDWGGFQSHLLVDFQRPPGIGMLGKTSRYGEPFPEPAELGTRASRAEDMTEREAERCIALLIENASVCLDLAEAFEQRLQSEGGIRRVQ